MFRYLVIITGVSGIGVTIALSPLLSKWSFGGLITTIPLYYFFKNDGIVPAILLTTVFTALSSWYYSKKYPVHKIKLHFRNVVKEGFNMIRLGLVMTIAGLLSQAVGYLVIIFISAEGGVSKVGLYNAGWTMTNQYVGLIFSAMAVDYFPRLAGVSEDNIKMKRIVNQQGEITLLLLAPLLILFILFLFLIVKVLFSREFMSIVPFAQWTALGMFFHASSWIISYVPGAKGDTNFFLIIEIIGSLLYYILTIIGYRFGKLEGVGVAFVLNYVLYLLIVFFSSRKRYKFNFSKSFLKIFFIQLFMLIMAFVSIKVFSSWLSYLVSGGCLIFSCIYSINELDKRMDLATIFKRF